MADSASRFTTVGIASGTFTLGTLAAAAVGSLLLGGNTITDRALNSAPSQTFGTGSYLTYIDSDNGATGTVKCTNTGGLAKYTACYVPNPFSGTGVIHRVQFDVNKSGGNSKAITCTTTAIGSTTVTGSQVGSALIRYGTTNSGTSVVNSTGAVVGYIAPIVLPGAGIRCWYSAQPTSSLKAQLRVWLSQQYIP